MRYKLRSMCFNSEVMINVAGFKEDGLALCRYLIEKERIGILADLSLTCEPFESSTLSFSAPEQIVTKVIMKGIGDAFQVTRKSGNVRYAGHSLWKVRVKRNESDMG